MAPDLFTWAREQAAERDAVLTEHERKAEAIRTATQVARRIDARQGQVTSTEVLRELERDHAEVIAGLDRRFLGAVLLPSKGWERTGEYKRIGSRGRPVPCWRWGGR